MATANLSDRINALFEREQWEKARSLLEKHLEKEPDSHWLLTQLAETYYEQRQYKKSLGLLLKSLDLVPDCPLTLWHLAGTLDALGDPAAALRIYAWLLESKKSSEDDPCWESTEWTDALKTDCVYRIGVCFQHLKRKDKAAYCFRHYIDLLLAGAAGSYSMEEAVHRMRELGQVQPQTVENELRKVADWVLHTSGQPAAPTEPPKLDRKKLRRLQEA